jgi:hypothetical protein
MAGRMSYYRLLSSVIKGISLKSPTIDPESWVRAFGVYEECGYPRS